MVCAVAGRAFSLRCVRCGGRHTTGIREREPLLLSGCCWGLVMKVRVEYDVGRHHCSVIELVVVVCFFMDVVLLYGIA
jgi:hypothetical protein